MKKLIFVLPLTATLALGISALAQESSFQMDMMNAHQKMMQDMMTAMKSTGDADKDFVMMMIPHHQGAIDMAEAELKYGKDPQLKKMAQQIIDAQKKEIDEFKKWESAHP